MYYYPGVGMGMPYMDPRMYTPTMQPYAFYPQPVTTPALQSVQQTMPRQSPVYPNQQRASLNMNNYRPSPYPPPLQNPMGQSQPSSYPPQFRPIPQGIPRENQATQQQFSRTDESMTETSHSSDKKRHKSKIGKICLRICIVLIVLIVVLILGGYALHRFHIL